MATKSRSAAAKKAWATRRKLYGKSGTSKASKSNKNYRESEKNKVRRLARRRKMLNRLKKKG